MWIEVIFHKILEEFEDLYNLDFDIFLLKVKIVYMKSIAQNTYSVLAK